MAEHLAPWYAARRQLWQALSCSAFAPRLLAATNDSGSVPEIKLRASDGEPVLSDASIAAGKWRATYIDFWASWCGPCKLSFPWLNQMHEQYAAKGLRIVAIGLDRKDSDAQRFLKSLPPRFAVALDPAADTATLLGLQVMPTSYLIGPGRRLLATHKGFRLDDAADTEAQLKAALA